MILKRKFFEKSTLEVAKNLLGKVLARKWRGKEMRAIITETEAYRGFDDKASHASRGMTSRNKIMFGPAGYAYIYLIYGMHYCLNIVTESENYPAAVLIRGARMITNRRGRISVVEINGPGKLTKALRIDRTLNGENIVKSQKLWIENVGCGTADKYGSARAVIKKGPRIGVDYAGQWAKKPWRFWISC